jgi:hypothetical protein
MITNPVEDILSQITAKTVERLKLQKQADKLDEEAKALTDKLNALGVVTGTYGRFLVERKAKPTPKADDWAQVWSYIRENNAFDLLHKRLTETAVMARFNAQEPIPGISLDDKITYKITGT